ncbi:MAG: UTRA domain-containing protein [Bacteroidetes bacterium]|nr:UTRA domain-containing protein [Bacteroidota bacterium]
MLKPHEITWPDELKPYLTKEQTESNCIFIKRLRRIDNKPIALELTYLPNIGLPDFCSLEFINDSLFETLEKRYLIEIKDVEEDIRAIKPCDEAIKYLKIKKNDPLLSINFKFLTNRSELSIYSTIYCDTSRYSVGNII